MKKLHLITVIFMLLASGSGINAQERFTSYSPSGHLLHYEVHYGDKLVAFGSSALSGSDISYGKVVSKVYKTLCKPSTIYFRSINNT